MSAATDLIHRLEEDVDSLEHRKQARRSSSSGLRWSFWIDARIGHPAREP